MSAELTSVARKLDVFVWDLMSDELQKLVRITLKRRRTSSARPLRVMCRYRERASAASARTTGTDRLPDL
jgi:hypothetical protein